jgi:hypothetical protein
MGVKLWVNGPNVFADGAPIEGICEVHVHNGKVCIIAEADVEDPPKELSLDAVIGGSQNGKELYKMLRLAYEGVEVCKLKRRI